jgi:hypothetical protein
MSAGPLKPWDKRLRLRRYEVTAHTAPSGPENRRQQLCETARWASLADAQRHAAELAELHAGTGALIVVSLWAPSNVRYPEGPWHGSKIEQVTA